MTPVSCSRPKACIDWLKRVDSQYNVQTPEMVKKADEQYAEQDLASNKVYNFFFPSSRPVFSRHTRSQAI